MKIKDIIKKLGELDEGGLVIILDIMGVLSKLSSEDVVKIDKAIDFGIKQQRKKWEKEKNENTN